MSKNRLFAFLFLFSGLSALAQVPVMSPISGPNSLCWSPTLSAIYSATASNNPTIYDWDVQPSNGVVLASVNPTAIACVFPNADMVYTISCAGINNSGQGNTSVITVTVREKPTVTFSGNKVICQGSSTNLSASPTISSGSSSLFYQWSPAYGLSPTSGPNVTANPTVTTNYTVTVFNGPCQYTVPLTITVNTPFSLTVSGNTLICENNSTSLSTNVTPPPSSVLYYGWTPSYGLSSTTAQNVTASPGVSTGYTVTANDGVCWVSNAISITVDPCVGIKEQEGLSQTLFVYPNPNNGRFILRSSESGEADLVNELGQTVRHIKFTAGNETEIENLNSGIYYLVGSRTHLKIAVLR